MLYYGSYFNKKSHFTHMGPSGSRREIDHILMPRRHLRCTMRFDIVGGLDSDHLLLRIKLRIAAFIPKKKREEHPQVRENAESTKELPQKRLDYRTPQEYEAKMALIGGSSRQ
jgi:hypothetical protein